MASNWAYFRKHWIKPEVYPLIGSMAAALGVCGAAMLNKVRDPSVTWNKTKRGAGLVEQLDGVDEIVPMWSSSKNSSIRIFGGENPVRDMKTQHTALPEPITIVVSPEKEEEEAASEPDATVEEEQNTEEPATEPVEDEPAGEAVTEEAAPAVLEVVDEAAETINAAVDAAIKTAAAAAPETTEPAVSSVSEAVAAVSPTPELESTPVADISESEKPARD